MTDDLQVLREEKIADMERRGYLVPSCRFCQAEFYPHYREKWQPGGSGPFAPSHQASRGCESGSRPHCTCDACF
jgi:hypothetical protein